MSHKTFLRLWVSCRKSCGKVKVAMKSVMGRSRCCFLSIQRLASSFWHLGQWWFLQEW